MRCSLALALLLSTAVHGTVLVALMDTVRTPAFGQSAAAPRLAVALAALQTPILAERDTNTGRPTFPVPTGPAPGGDPVPTQRRDTADTVTTPTVVTTGSSAPASTAGATRITPALRALIRNRLQRELSARFRYPYIARRRGWEGRVVLGLRLAPDGRIHRPRVVHSSGHRVLDHAALDAVAGAGPLDWAPPLLQGAVLDLDLPVIYRLTGE